MRRRTRGYSSRKRSYKGSKTKRIYYASRGGIRL